MCYCKRSIKQQELHNSTIDILPNARHVRIFRFEHQCVAATTIRCQLNRNSRNFNCIFGDMRFLSFRRGATKIQKVPIADKDLLHRIILLFNLLDILVLLRHQMADRCQPRDLRSCSTSNRASRNCICKRTYLPIGRANHRWIFVYVIILTRVPAGPPHIEVCAHTANIRICYFCVLCRYSVDVLCVLERRLENLECDWQDHMTTTKLSLCSFPNGFNSQLN